MASAFDSYQAFVRRFLQDDSNEWETDCEVVRLKVNAFANSSFDTRKDGSGVVLSSNIEGVAFSYRIDGQFDQDGLIRHATRFLAAIEAINPKDVYEGWDALTTQQKDTLNLRAIKRLRLILRRRKKTAPSYLGIPL